MFVYEKFGSNELKLQQFYAKLKLKLKAHTVPRPCVNDIVEAAKSLICMVCERLAPPQGRRSGFTNLAMKIRKSNIEPLFQRMFASLWPGSVKAPMDTATLCYGTKVEEFDLNSFDKSDIGEIRCSFSLVHRRERQGYRHLLVESANQLERFYIKL